MSEPELEPQEPAEEPSEEPAAPSPEEEEEEAEETEDEPQEPAEPEPEGEPQGFTEKELEATRKKLDNENSRHRARISDLIGDEATLLVPCELCNGFADGYRFPVVPPPEVIEAVRVAIGLPDLTNYQQAKHTTECPDCSGLGVVLSGSKVAENAAIKCRTCNGSGYVVLDAAGEIKTPAQYTNGGTTHDVPEGVNPNDPAVAELRARGFTVFPPVPIAAG